MGRLATILRVGALGAVALVAAGCGDGDADAGAPRPDREFCEAAAELDETLSRTSSDEGLDEEIALLEEMVAHAPADIAADTRTFLDAMRAARDGDATLDDPLVAAAVGAVNRRATEGCGLLEQGGSSPF